MTQAKNLEGQRFDNWHVLARHGSRYGKANWLAVCDCGTFGQLTTGTLLSGISKSCGCRKPEISRAVNTQHGQSYTPAYTVWLNVVQRTTNPNNDRWPAYGGRGIGISDSWRDFKNFYADMGAVPEGMQLDRRDNSKGYSKENCRWVTGSQNMRNTRVNHLLEYQGQMLPLVTVSEMTGIKVATLYKRLAAGDVTPHLLRPVAQK